MAITVDINDPEVIESLSFLLVPKEERILNATKPFDSKKMYSLLTLKKAMLQVKFKVMMEENAKLKNQAEK